MSAPRKQPLRAYLRANYDLYLFLLPGLSIAVAPRRGWSCYARASSSADPRSRASPT